MTKLDVVKECEELIARFKRLKKALEEEDGLSPAQRAAAEVAQAFAQRTAAREQLAKRRSTAAVESMQAQNLAKMLQDRGILGSRPPPRQPTDQELFGHLVPSEEALAAEKNWGNSINNWLTEVTKPLNARFKTPEEEQAYWNSIRVNGSDGSDQGY